MALSLNHRFSVPSLFFHDVTVAPWRRTVTDSLVGSVAVMVESEMSTTGSGAFAAAVMAEGLFARSTIVKSRVRVRGVLEVKVGCSTLK